MIIRPTSKLAKQLGLKPTEVLPLAGNGYLDWSCRVFDVWAGQSLMLITNTASLYSTVVTVDGLKTQEQFINGLPVCLKQRLIADGFEYIFLDHIFPVSGTVELSKALNRSVTGSMSDMVSMATITLQEGKSSLEEVIALLNRTPFKALEYDHPKDKFVDLH